MRISLLKCSYKNANSCLPAVEKKKKENQTLFTSNTQRSFTHNTKLKTRSKHAQCIKNYFYVSVTSLHSIVYSS